MGKYNTFGGRLRSWGGRGPDAGSYAGSVPLTAKATFDATSTTQVELFTLPAGAIPLATQSFGGASGGTNPTVDIGTTGSSAGIANELDADDPAWDATGALLGTALSSATTIYGKVGGSAGTAGSTTIVHWYVMEDDNAGGDASGS